MYILKWFGSKIEWTVYTHKYHTGKINAGIRTKHYTDKAYTFMWISYILSLDINLLKAFFFYYCCCYFGCCCFCLVLSSFFHCSTWYLLQLLARSHVRNSRSLLTFLRCNKCEWAFNKYLYCVVFYGASKTFSLTEIKCLFSHILWNIDTFIWNQNIA